MTGPIKVPPEDPSTSSRIVEGIAPNGEPIVSVIYGMTFAVGRDGRCTAKNYTIVDGTVFEKARTAGRYTRPSLLLRDADTWAWKSFTDVVVQGSARSDVPVARLDIALSVHGSRVKLDRSLSISGDRWVDRGKTGLVLSDAVPFVEMPLRYDRAYGGTDELAEDRQADEETLNFYVKNLSPEENEEISGFSYPRNAAGRGYLVEPDGASGLAWPNLEFPEDRLRLETLARPMDEWGERPYPACFDWFHHAWFPRSAFIVDLPPVRGDKVPAADRRLGLFEEGWEDKTVEARSQHPFANGAHPYLCRHRLVGNETVKVTHTSTDGRDFNVTLPGLAPRASLRLMGEPRVVIPGTLDLVFVESELDQVTLVWRSTHMTGRAHLPIDWLEKTEYKIDW